MLVKRIRNQSQGTDEPQVPQPMVKAKLLELQFDLVQSIAHRKVTDTDVAVCPLLLILTGNFSWQKERTVSVNKGMSEEPKGC